MDFTSDSTPEEREEAKRVRAEINKYFFDQQIDAIERSEYNKTNNPLFLFSAYQKYRTQNYPLPDWILSYFDLFAGRLLGVAGERAVGIKHGDTPANLVYEILGMKNVFNQYALHENKSEAVHMFFQIQMTQPERTDESIIDEIERFFAKKEFLMGEEFEKEYFRLKRVQPDRAGSEICREIQNRLNDPETIKEPCDKPRKTAKISTWIYEEVRVRKQKAIQLFRTIKEMRSQVPDKVIYQEISRDLHVGPDKIEKWIRIG